MNLSLIGSLASSAASSAMGRAGDAVGGLLRKSDKNEEEQAPLQQPATTTTTGEPTEGWGDATVSDLEPEGPRVSVERQTDRQTVFTLSWLY